MLVSVHCPFYYYSTSPAFIGHIKALATFNKLNILPRGGISRAELFVDTWHLTPNSKSFCLKLAREKQFTVIAFLSGFEVIQILWIFGIPYCSDRWSFEWTITIKKVKLIGFQMQRSVVLHLSSKLTAQLVRGLS